VADRGWVLGAVALALTARLLVALVTGLSAIESFEYDDIARNLLAGAGYMYHHLGTPYYAFYSGVPYVWLLAAAYALSGGHTVAAALVVQALASAALVVVIFLIGRRVGGAGLARAAAALVALHPAIAFYDTHKIHSLSFDALAMALAVLALLRLSDTMDATTALIAGAALGVAILQRGTMLVAGPPVGLVWLVATRRCAAAQWLRVGVSYGLGALLLVSPLVVRNWVVVGEPILSSIAAESLWRGNAPHSRGGSYVSRTQSVLEAVPDMWARLQGKSELQQAELFRAAFAADLAADPWLVARKVARKLFTFWWFAAESGYRYPAHYFYLYMAFYSAGVVFAGIGVVAVVSARSVKPAAFEASLLLGTLALVVSVVQSVFYVEIRHRWAVEAMLVIFAAMGMLRTWAAVHAPRLAVARVPR
jgi:4-amino-4-deoxy-L-arabinose transferase-like glycosyltransferase